VIHEGMPYDPIQTRGQVHKDLKCVKIANLKPISSANMHVIKRLMENCDMPIQYLNFYWTDFLIFVFV